MAMLVYRRVFTELFFYPFPVMAGLQVEVGIPEPSKNVKNILVVTSQQAGGDDPRYTWRIIPVRGWLVTPICKP